MRRDAPRVARASAISFSQTSNSWAVVDAAIGHAATTVGQRCLPAQSGGKSNLFSQRAKEARRSSARAWGCFIVAKQPPRGIAVQRRMLVNIFSASRAQLMARKCAMLA
jgi:hypothetical protein